MNDCLFCKIVKGDIPSKKAYEDDRVYAFYDIAPAAPVHVLVIPKEHILAGVDEVTGQTADIVGYIFTVIPKIAKELGLENGYRIVSNVGTDAGQTVRHIHFHIIGGAQLGAMA